MSVSADENTTLNGICPYFSMFPLSFPLNLLKEQAKQEERVLDPFCGRGTTIFAARLLGLRSWGIDSNPVAAAIAEAKLASVRPEKIVSETRKILDSEISCPVPSGRFWELAFHSEVLAALSKLRSAFLKDCSTPERIALRGIILGALHGPKGKKFASYFSNQSPRTYSPKPKYSIKFWEQKNLLPDHVNIFQIIERRAKRFYNCPQKSKGIITLGDSRQEALFLSEKKQFKWVVTSPPYYGMCSYFPDQWLRNWFLGGDENVSYKNNIQLSHLSPDAFSKDLNKVWKNVGKVCKKQAKMIVRFGGLSSKKKIDPLTLLKSSLKDSGWKIQEIKTAGDANSGKRQANAFLKSKSKPLPEYDVYALKA